MANELLKAIQHSCFVVPETTVGQIAYPNSGHYVIPAGYASLKQTPSYTDSEEIIDSRSLIAQFQDRTKSGSWSIPMYIRPSGTGGVPPQGDALLQGLLGNKITSGSEVQYTLSQTLPSYTIWSRLGQVVFFATGATVNEGKVNITDKGGIKVDLSGGFTTMGWCGVSNLTVAAALGDTSITVADGKQFTVGGKVKFVDAGTVYDKSGAGYKITSVTGNVIGIEPLEVPLSIGAEVKPFLPTGTVVGSPLECRSAVISFDGGTTNVVVKNIDVNVSNGIQYLEDEISQYPYPTTYVEGKRSVKGKVDLYFRQADLQYITQGYTGNIINLKLTLGNTTGSMVELIAPRVRLTVPDINVNAPTVSLSMDWTALATNPEDEFKIIFK